MVARQRVAREIETERVELGQRRLGRLGAGGRGDLSPRADQQQLGAHLAVVDAAGVEGTERGLAGAERAGTRVLCSAAAQLRDGKIVREVVIQAWDA